MIGLRGHHVRGAAVAAGLAVGLALAAEPMPSRTESAAVAESTPASATTTTIPEATDEPLESVLRRGGCSPGFIQDFSRGQEDQQQARRDGLGCVRAHLTAKRARAAESIGTNTTGRQSEAGDEPGWGARASVSDASAPRRAALEHLRAARCSDELLGAVRARKADQALARKSGLRCLAAFIVIEEVLPPVGAEVAPDPVPTRQPTAGATRSVASVAAQSLRDALQRGIAVTVEREGERAYQRVAEWREQEKRLPQGIKLYPAFDSLLRALEGYRACKTQVARLEAGESIPTVCMLFAPTASKAGDGARWINFDRRTADDRIRALLARAKGQAAFDQRDAAASGAEPSLGLYELFAYLSSDRVLKAPGIRGNALSFRDAVETTFRDARQDLGCISRETWSAIEPEVAWTWIAFSDCRSAAAAYGDAAENLDVAARYLGPHPDHPLKRLALARLAALSDLAKRVGKEAEVRAKLGLRPQSRWLADAHDNSDQAGKQRAEGVTGDARECDTTIPLETGTVFEGRDRATMPERFEFRSARGSD